MALRSADQPHVEKLVVLNGASATTESLAWSLADRVISLPTAGLGAARQAGLEAARSNAAMFLDSDCTIRSGSVSAILESLQSYDVVRLGLEYDARTAGQRMVARVRVLTTTATPLPLLPYAFNLEAVRKLGEPLFDRNLAWGEDWPAAQRLLASHLRIGLMPEPVILHRPLGIVEDLRSARNLGRGRRLRVEHGLEKPRSLSRDIAHRGEIRRYRETRRLYGDLEACYHLFGWRWAYKYGYYEQALRERQRPWHGGS